MSIYEYYSVYSNVMSVFWVEGKDLYDKKEIHEDMFFSLTFYVLDFFNKIQT